MSLGGLVVAQGPTLKATAPVAQSPAHQVFVSTTTPILTSTSADALYDSGRLFEQYFELEKVEKDGQTTLFETGRAVAFPSGASYTVQSPLVIDGLYRWRVRAELAGAVAPWSDWATFRFASARAKWTLRYAEDFSVAVDEAGTPWRQENYSDPYDTVLDDAGLWYQNDYGPAWRGAFRSFATYRKEIVIGEDDWLTASLSARDWDRDGVIEIPPKLFTLVRGGRNVVVLEVPDHTGGVILRPTHALPPEYRIEFKLMTLDFGGKRDGALAYGGRINGYASTGCRTQHPWGEGSNTVGWLGDASVPYCEWQGVREGPFAYNGLHFLTIVDLADPAPRNNHFWHYHRKVLMDAFSQHPDRVKRIDFGTGGRVCNSATGKYYAYRDGNFNTVNMWISGLPNWKPSPGGVVSNSQWFMTTCSDGLAEQGLVGQQVSSAAELQPELMPDEFYTFAIERDNTSYTLEVSGNFARVGRRTLRFRRPFVVNGVPIWHYNVSPEEYDGQFNGDLLQNDRFGQMTWPNQWPAGSAYPDYFVIGDLYTNAYEGSASLTDVRLYVPAG